MTDTTILPTVTPPATPISTPPAAAPANGQAPARKFKPFVPINPPPSDHHGVNTGLSTELGDSAKQAFEKINDGFKHVYSMLTGVPQIAGDAASAVKAVETKASGQVSTWINDFETRLKNVEDMLHEILGKSQAPAATITLPPAAAAAATASSPAKS